MCELSVVVPTCPSRMEKLEALLKGIATTACDHDAFEVVVVVDDLDDTPIEAARAVLPPSIHMQGLTQAHHGPARARNAAIQHARGRWVLIFDDDVLVNEHTIGGHLQQIRCDPRATLAYLGRTEWPPKLLDSPWRVLLANSPMLFFWDTMRRSDLRLSALLDKQYQRPERFGA